MTIQQIAATHNIDKNKENFPVNTIRLFYLVLIHTLTSDSPQKDSEKIIKAIPIVSSILDKRTDLRLSGDDKNINKEWQTVEPELNQLEEIIPGAKKSFEYLFSTTLPAQEDLLFNIVNQAQEDGKVFKPTDILATLKLRSMDSIAYSHLVCNIVKKPEHNLAIHFLTNLVHQVNDLMDSILFAKEDTENNNFSPFEVIRKSAKDSAEAKAIIKSILDRLVDDKSQVSLPTESQKEVDEFFNLLTRVIGDVSTSKDAEKKEELNEEVTQN